MSEFTHINGQSYFLSIMILIGAPYGVCGFDCVPSDDGVCSESKTDTGHMCGMYMCFVDLYICAFDQVGISIVYKSWADLLSKYKKLSQGTYVPPHGVEIDEDDDEKHEVEDELKQLSKWLYDCLMKRWKRMCCPLHVEAFMLDPRWVNHTDYIEGYGVNDYMEHLQDTLSVEKYTVITQQFMSFRNRTGIYERLMRGINDKSDYKTARDFWKNVKFRFGGNGEVMQFHKIGWKCIRIPPGSVAVESSFRAIKLIQTPLRGALSWKKQCKLVYIHNNLRWIKSYKALQ